MRELGSTGFMSNRGRQNVASFLVYNLQVDWRWGAEYFETMLIDHHPCPNWGNWHSIAGLQRSTKIFNIARQSWTYDRKGAYVRHWIPELRCVPDALVHQPWAWDGRDALQKEKGGYFDVEPMASAVDMAAFPKRKRTSRSRSLGMEDWPVTALEDKFFPNKPLIELKNLCGGYSPRGGNTFVFTPQTRMELKTRIDSCLNEALMELRSHDAPHIDVADRNGENTFKEVYIDTISNMSAAVPGATPITTSAHASVNASSATPHTTVNASSATPHTTPTSHGTGTTNFKLITTAVTTMMSTAANMPTAPMIATTDTFITTPANTPATTTSTLVPAVAPVIGSASTTTTTAAAATMTTATSVLTAQDAAIANDWVSHGKSASGFHTVRVRVGVIR